MESFGLSVNVYHQDTEYAKDCESMPPSYYSHPQYTKADSGERLDPIHQNKFLAELSQPIPRLSKTNTDFQNTISEKDAMECSAREYDTPDQEFLGKRVQRHASLTKVIEKMFKTSRLLVSESFPAVKLIFKSLVDRDVLPIRQGDDYYYALKEKRPNQLIQKFHCFVRSALKAQCKPQGWSNYFGITKEQAELLNKNDPKKVVRSIVLNNKKLREFIFDPEQFEKIFQELQQDTIFMLQKLLKRAEKLIRNPKDKSTRKEFEAYLRKEKIKNPFTEVENYWSAILYCRWFIPEDKSALMHKKIHEIADNFLQKCKDAGLWIPEEQHPRPSRYNVVASQINLRFQAYLVETKDETEEKTDDETEEEMEKKMKEENHMEDHTEDQTDDENQLDDQTENHIYGKKNDKPEDKKEEDLNYYLNFDHSSTRPASVYLENGQLAFLQ